VVEAARDSGITTFVQTTAGIDPGQGAANREVKAIIEALVREAFPQAFIIRPVWFIESLNLTSFNLAHRTFKFVTGPNQPHAWVSCDARGGTVHRAPGGECQRINHAGELHKKGSLDILDEPTTELHMSDIVYQLQIINRLVDRGPEGGRKGGRVLFEGHQLPDHPLPLLKEQT